jgi:hypothetical protein
MTGEQEEAHALQRRVHLGGHGRAGILVSAEPGNKIDNGK